MIYVEDYIEEISSCLNKEDYIKFNNKVIALTGATGLIGSYFIDALLIHQELDVKIIALVRNIDSAKRRFNYFVDDKRLSFEKVDLLNKIEVEGNIDYLIHAASLTDPLNYSLHPIDTMNTNYIGTKNMLDLAKLKKAKFMFVSSCEVYGKNENQMMKENEYGYIDILDARSCYNESKRASETLCICYKKEHNIDVVIPRLSRIYGPTMKIEDTKALSQFINKSLHNEDIVLKSEGKQLFDYTYVGDIARVFVVLLTKDNKNIAYNINSNELVELRKIAEFIASLSNKKVIFELPSNIELKGFSKSLVSSMDSSLFKDEYNFNFDVKLFDGIERTINLLRKMK